MNLYKGKYAIGIYKIIKRIGETDELVDLFESTEEFAQALNISMTCAYNLLRNHKTGANSKIVIGGKFYELAFIDMLED